MHANPPSHLCRSPRKKRRRTLGSASSLTPSSVVVCMIVGVCFVGGMLSPTRIAIRRGLGFGIRNYRRCFGADSSGGSPRRMVDESKNLWSIEGCLDEWKDTSSKRSKKIQFVDATWFHKGERNGREEFERGPRLPNAIHWDIGDLATTFEFFPNDNPKGLKNVFPPEWFVGEALGRMGVLPPNGTTNATASKTLVVYGRDGTLFAPRVWYMLKKYYIGGPVRLLQGSLEEWIVKGGPVDCTLMEPGTTLRAREIIDELSDDENSMSRQPLHPWISANARDRLVDMKFVLDLVKREQQTESNDETSADEEKSSSLAQARPSMILDTRGSSFSKNGHIPGAVHIPYASLSLPGDSSTLKSRNELTKVLKEALGDSTFEKLRTEPPLLTCGTGVSVCTLALVLDELELAEPWIYDGSWNEWGQDPSTPKAGGTVDGPA